MANGWNTDSDREAMLRRVAIVLSSLPDRVATRLLNSMGSESKQAVRRTMTTLADVDPLERQRAVQAFRVSVQQQPVAAASTRNTRAPHGDTANGGFPDSAPLATSEAAAGPAEPRSRVVSSPGQWTSGIQANDGRSDDHASAVNQSPLSFLGDVEDDTLVILLAAEHPQAVALVLASIAPAQAARILPQLDARMRGDTLSRLGRLGEIPEAAAKEVADHFRGRLGNLGNERNRSGRRALDAIIAAMPKPPIEVMQSTSGDSSTTPAEVYRSPAAEITRNAASSFPSADHPASDLSQKLRVAQQTGPEGRREEVVARSSAESANSAASDDRQPTAKGDRRTAPAADWVQATDMALGSDHLRVDAQSIDHAMSDEATIDDASLPQSTDAIHQHLIQLSAVDLCRALGKVPTRDAMLCLCGLPNSIVGAALAILPRAHAKKVRSSMNGLGSLQLREIDDAKERVARAAVANRDSAQGQVPLAA